MIKNFFKSVFYAIFPKNFTCDICGKETFDGNNLCEKCKPTVKFNNGVTCPVCGRKNVINEICMECKALAPQFDKAYSPLIYGDGTSALIGKFKKGSGYLKDYFCDLVIQGVKNFPEFDFITYIPVTKKTKSKRGYNQARLLARELSKRLNVKVIDDVLIKLHDTEEQKGLSKRKRLENLKGCFRVHKRKECKGKRILLVDDVLTTGATADEACKLLRGAKAKKIYFITVASVEYKPEREIIL